MWDLGNYTNSSAASMANSLHAMHEIHVLLVDHEPEALIHTAKQLELCHYRVTLVELASAAISMLLSGKAKFDVVIANINSPDLHGFKLLQQAVTVGLPIVLMSVDENAFMAMRALESGAFLYIKKPATMEILRYLWQLVMREKTRMARERELFLAANNINHGPLIENPNLVRGLEVRGEGIREIENPNFELTSSMKNKKKKAASNEECDNSENNWSGLQSNVRKKMCTEWTHELHAKFMNAIEILGEGRCFPKEILDLMNVPGLTRMQVASHLQKCRNDNWKSPEERKPAPAVMTPQQATNNQDSSTGSQPKPRRFGSKPQVGKSNSGQVQVQSAGQGSGSPSGSTPINFAYHHKKYGAIGYVGGTSSSANANELFNFPETDFLMHNLSARPTADHPNDHKQQNSGDGAASVETRSLWSSDTSNFESTEHSAETCRENHD